MQHTTIYDFADNVDGSLSALTQVIGPILTLLGFLLLVKTIFWFKSAMDNGEVFSPGEGVIRIVASFALIGMSSFVSTIGETVLTSEEFTLSSPGKVLAEAADGKESSKEDDALQLIPSEGTDEPASLYAKECLTEGGFATYQGGKVEILLDQGNGWYRIKNQYGESSSKQKSDMECM